MDSAVRGPEDRPRINRRARKRRRRRRIVRALIAWAVCILFAALVAMATFRLITYFTSAQKRGYRQEGIEKLENRDYRGAIDSFDQALESSGKRPSSFNIDVLRYRAEAELGLEDYEAALYTYGLLEEADKENSVFYGYVKTLCYSCLGDSENGLSSYREAAASDPEKGTGALGEEALCVLGSVFRAAGEYDQAKSLYEEAIRNGVEYAQIYNELGLCQMAEEDYEGASDSFDAGYEIIATRYNAGTGAPLTQVMQVIPAEAQRDAAQLKELAYNRAVVWEYLQQYKKALEQFEEYVSVFGEDEKAQHEIDFLRTR
jgi:tetratricopeptide (TPR) repeat protein